MSPGFVAGKGIEMGHTRWADLEHKASPERRAESQREALAELDRVGYAALRKAQELTRAELAAELGLSPEEVAGLEGQIELQQIALGKHLRAMGGELEIRAVFPEATFNLKPPALAVAALPMPRESAERVRHTHAT